jgi:uncharacterized cupredoxin-like copper-binding protein
MRNRYVITGVLAAGVLLAGCAGTDDNAPDENSSEAEAATDDDAPDESSPEAEATTDDDHGDVAMGEPADAADASRTIEVEALDIAFDPESLSVEGGEVVTFVVTNTGQAVHEFTLGDAAMQQEHADEMAEMDGGMAHDEPNSISLEPGETKELTWQFGEGGTVEYACHEPGHYEAGMHGDLTIG